jgi:hypothetical protein
LSPGHGAVEPTNALFHLANRWTLGTPVMDACEMTDRDRSLSWRVAAMVGRTRVKALGFFLSVVKPPKQMKALQTMLPPETFPPRADGYRP